MEHKSKAKIISCNFDNTAICAGAARISTTEGDSDQVFEKSKNNPNNEKHIKKVLKSGHRSTVEHAVFTLSMRNVSVYVEQFFIEFRLASFTVKSRRYVDFARQGYYIPDGLPEAEQDFYCGYMDMLFGAYQKLLLNDIPKEDARFLLPYSFNSNFYCTLNARELINLIRSAKYGRGKEIPELNALADQIVEQLKEVFPCILDEIAPPPAGSGERTEECGIFNTAALSEEPIFRTEDEVGGVEMLNSPAAPMKLLEAACKLSGSLSDSPLDMGELILSQRPRELEQLGYTFLISDVTLSGITHLVRHRMQSIIVPPIQTADLGCYIMPRSISNSVKAREIYTDAVVKAHKAVISLQKNVTLKKYIYYFALSGNLMNVMTTVNARELLLFIRLRTCNRAQWEVKNAAVRMLKELREHFPELFDLYGPSCYVCGVCPEGDKSCGKMKEVRERFSERGTKALI